MLISFADEAGIPDSRRRGYQVRAGAERGPGRPAHVGIFWRDVHRSRRRCEQVERVPKPDLCRHVGIESVRYLRISYLFIRYCCRLLPVTSNTVVRITRVLGVVDVGLITGMQYTYPDLGPSPPSYKREMRSVHQPFIPMRNEVGPLYIAGTTSRWPRKSLCEFAQQSDTLLCQSTAPAVSYNAPGELQRRADH
jgi:hypothetical protein